MTLQTYLLCFLAAILGLSFHITAVKLPAIKNSAKIGNVPFSFKNFLLDESGAILSTIVMIISSLFLVDEFIGYAPKAEPYLKAIFFFGGYVGSSLLVSILGKAQARIDQVVDEKTNIADNK